VAGDVGAVLWPRVLLGGDFTVGMACGGAVPGECRLELQLLRGGVALHWAGVPAGLSTAIGEASVGRLVAAAAAYELGVLIVEVAAASWGEREGSMSIGADVAALVRLETEVLSVVGGAKEGQETSILLGGVPFFLAAAHVGEEGSPQDGVGVVWEPRDSVGDKLFIRLACSDKKVGSESDKLTTR